MLREIPNVGQIHGEGRRRWFSDSYFDLIVWYAEDGTVSGFQLCYDKHGHERAFTWRKGHRCVHKEIDAEMSPVLGGNPSAPARGVGKRFFWECANIDDRAIVRLIHDTIDGYLSKEGTRDPVCGRSMNRGKAYAVIRHNEVEYLLCCPKCQSEFEADPQRYEAASLGAQAAGSTRTSVTVRQAQQEVQPMLTMGLGYVQAKGRNRS